MKTSILLAIICFSFNVKAESIDFNALITEVEASIAQQVKTVATTHKGSKSRLPASDVIDSQSTVSNQATDTKAQ